VRPDYSRSADAGHNPVAFDAVGSTLMGFDIDKIPLVKRGLEAAQRTAVVPGWPRNRSK